MSSTSNQMTPADQAVVRALPGNKTCIECNQTNPQWASVSFGIVFCLECSGKHRGLGTHISFVRSIAMDNWTPEQLQIMKAGGNQQCMDYLKSKGVSLSFGESPRKRYDNEAAVGYKVQLKAKSNGRPNDIEQRIRQSHNKGRRGSSSSRASRKKEELFQRTNGSSRPTVKTKLTPAQEAHQITTSLLRTKHMLEQNLDATHGTSNALESDSQALKQAKEGQSEIVNSTKGAKGALRALKRQDVQERVVLVCAVGFYCLVVVYVLWTRIRIPFLLW